MADRILLQQPNPDGTFQAIVEDDGQTVTLYLVGDPALQRPLRACWVRNRVAATERFDPSPAREGMAPIQPAAHTTQPGPGPELSAEDLHFVWLQEGDGVALLQGDEVLAVLPGWSTGREQPGYAREAVGEGPLAWSLADAPALLDRVRQDLDWWNSWEGDPFTPIRDAQHQAIEEQLGPVSNYFAIDGGQWPPRAAVLVDRPPGRIVLTLAMALRRQPQAEQHLGDAPGRRIELALALHPSIGDEHPWLSALSTMASLPWRRSTWLGAGHTLSTGGLPAPFGAIFLHPAPPEGVQLALPDVDGEPVLVLWGTPITAAERALAQQYGRDKLVERLGSALGQVMVRSPVA